MPQLAGFDRYLCCLIGIFLLVGCVLGCRPAYADATSNEQALTVAFLYNFLKFTEWPTGSIKNEIILCVSDRSVFGDELEAISGRSVQNKSVRIKQVELGEKLDTCQLLFLSREEKSERTREWLKNSERIPTLLVSNLDDFLDMGGMIALIDDGNRLQFEVNLARTKPVGLKLSAQLLKIAKDVRGN